MKILRRTPLRTFVLYPLIVILWELSVNQGRLRVEPFFLLFMLGAICNTAFAAFTE